MRRGFPKLLCDPGVGGMGGDAKMKHSPRAKLDDEEGVDLPEEEVDDWEEVTSPDQLGVVLDEG